VLVPPPGRNEEPQPALFRPASRFGNPPLHFEALPAESLEAASTPGAQPPRFVARSRGGVVALTAGAVTLQLPGPSGSARKQASETGRDPAHPQPAFWPRKPGPSGSSSPGASPSHGATIRMTLHGANPAEPRGIEPLPGRTHLLLGNDPSHWRQDIPQYAKVRYDEVYEGIDLVLYGNPDELEYDFAVAPGADPTLIRMKFGGSQRPSIDAAGDLVIETAAGAIRHRRPRAYQAIDGAERTVFAAFEIDPEDNVRFQIGEYDRRYPLVIDPVLVYATYLGGRGTDLGQSLAVDSQGCVYITGHVASSDFPRTTDFAPPGSPNVNNAIVFVTKLDPNGTSILYSTLFGGDDYEIANGVAVDSEGSAYVVGETQSNNFPVTTRALQRNKADGSDAFIAKLSPDGASLIYSTFLGGDEIDYSTAIALDSAGSAYVAGVTYSEDFPTTQGAYQRDYAAGRDVFAAKLSADGSRLLYSTFIGGSGTDLANAVAIDASGNAYLAGLTDARRSAGVADAYCLKLDPTGGKVLYAKLFGGTGLEEANAVAVDAAGNAYLTGSTFSKNFPTTAGALQRESISPEYQPGLPIGYDAFVVKLDPTGQDLVFSTYLNGTWSSRGQAIALDADGNILVTGYTHSPDFPITAGALPPPPSDNQFKGFLATLNPAGSDLQYSTRFGGSNVDQAWDLALDLAGNIYVAGFSVSSDFPTSEGTLQPAHHGAFDAFILKFSSAGPPAVAEAGIVSGASFLGGAVAPGMLVSIFGSGLGPPEGALLELDGSGYAKTQLQGTRVLFNDVPAPLVFLSPTQVGAVVPYALDGNAVRVVVEAHGVRSPAVEVPLSDSAPGLFTLDSSGAGGGAILNQDGSINAAENPAERGSIVALFGTGEGQTEPAGQDGKIAAEVPPQPRQQVAVTIGGLAAEILYAGGAPGLVAGVIQVNARVPAGLAAETGEVPVVLQVGNATSQPGVTLSVR
jgi:uncharacterized protein (TIGR03437 family)